MVYLLNALMLPLIVAAILGFVTGWANAGDGPVWRQAWARTALAVLAAAAATGYFRAADGRLALWIESVALLAAAFALGVLAGAGLRAVTRSGAETGAEKA
jgi:hypothetical protein